MSEWGAIITVGFYLIGVTALLTTVLVSWSSAAEKQRMIDEAQKEQRYVEEKRLRRLEEENRRRVEKERLREFIKGPVGDFAVFLSALFPRLGELLLTGSISMRQAVLSFAGLAGALLGGALGLVLRPTNPLVGQLPLGAVVTRGTYLEGMDRLLVPLAEYSFNMMLGGVVVGALAGVSIAYFARQQYARTTSPEASSSEATKPCPFCAETIKAAANVCHYCGHDLAKEGAPQ